jgi:hypothetical protein
VTPSPAVERECPSRVRGVVSFGGKTALRPEGTSASPPTHVCPSPLSPHHLQVTFAWSAPEALWSMLPQGHQNTGHLSGIPIPSPLHCRPPSIINPKIIMNPGNQPPHLAAHPSCEGRASAPFTLPLHHPPPCTAACLTCALRLQAQPLAMDPLPRSSGPPWPSPATAGFASPFPCYRYPSCTSAPHLPFLTGLCPHVFTYIIPPTCYLRSS